MRFFSALKQNFLFYLMAVLILASGFAGFKVMGELKTPIEASPVVREAPLVDASYGQAMSGPLPIRAEGFVSPFRQVDVSAPAGGKLISLNPAVENLGTIKAGEVLARLDDRAAQANLARANADLKANLANLALLEKQQSRTQSLVQRGALSQDALDQLETQIRQIQATTDSLRAARQSALVAVENTQIIAPFDGQISQQIAQLGAVLSSGQPLANLFTHEKLEVEVSLSERESALIPGLFDESPASAKVINEFGGIAQTFPAKVSRVKPNIDPTTRTLGVTVSIDSQNPTSGIPLLPNAYVKVVIDGRVDPNLFKVPSSALRGADQLWLADGDTLRIERVDVVHRDQGDLFVLGSERLNTLPVITSALDSGSEGMSIRLSQVAEQQVSAR